MKHYEFEIGQDFTMSGKTYRCTDVGKRTIVAIRIDAQQVTKTNIADVRAYIRDGKPFRSERRTLTGAEADKEGWFKGPPYACAEHVIDEDSQEVCHPVK